MTTQGRPWRWRVVPIAVFLLASCASSGSQGSSDPVTTSSAPESGATTTRSPTSVAAPVTVPPGTMVTPDRSGPTVDPDATTTTTSAPGPVASATGTTLAAVAAAGDCDIDVIRADLGTPAVADGNVVCVEDWALGWLGFTCEGPPPEEGECESADLAQRVGGTWVLRASGVYPFCGDHLRSGHPAMPYDVAVRFAPVCDPRSFGFADEPAEGALHPGVGGYRVVELQRALIEEGADLLPDGLYGDDTEEAVCAFERSRGLTCDGIADAAVLDLLGLR